MAIVIPRRITPDDADYNVACGLGLKIRLDGIDQYGVVCGYDLDAGTLTRAKVDAGGKFFVDTTTDAIALETVSGHVVVTLGALTASSAV